MLQRMLPAIAFELNSDIDADDALSNDVLAMAPRFTELVEQRMANCTTAQLEGHLANYHECLLMVRTVSALGSSIWGTNGVCAYRTKTVLMRTGLIRLVGVAQAQTTFAVAVAPQQTDEGRPH